MRTAALLAVMALAGLPADATAEVYTCTDEEGRTVFRDKPCSRGERRGAATADATTGSTQRPARRAASAAPLERERVERLVGRLDKAMSKRDPKAVAALLAKDAEVEIAGDGRSMLPKAYAHHLAAAFARPGYLYEPKTPRISLSKTKPRATVTRMVREGARVGGQPTAIELRERLTVEQEGRRLLIRKLHRRAG